MPTISKSVTINADIETVFDLISRVEEFPLYASMLKEVREIGHHTYRWVARVRGLTLSWDSVITEYGDELLLFADRNSLQLEGCTREFQRSGRDYDFPAKF